MSTPTPSGLDACTRCGMCLQACPTYRGLRLEADSPRGRVFLVKQAVEDEDSIGAAMAEHLYQCLGCRACETACPSGVPFGKLLEFGRHAIEEAGEIDSTRRGWRTFRRFAFEWILPRPALFNALMSVPRWLQRRPRLVAALRAMPLPPRARRLLAMLPLTQRNDDRPNDDGAVDLYGRPPRSSKLDRYKTSPKLDRYMTSANMRVGVFTGCVMNALFGDVHAALLRVLRHNAVEPVAAPGQWCCGALNLHAGERRHALAMARRNVDAFEKAGVDAIVVDSAGCGAQLKSYGDLLKDDAEYAERANTFSAKVADAAEFLAAVGIRNDFQRLNARVTYQDACHLAHGQGIREQPRSLLRAIPGLELVEMRDADRCCGAAGVYALTHPQMSDSILEEKMARIEETRADTVVVTNPGCHMQLLAGAAAKHARFRVCHLIEIIDEAYRA